MWIHIMGRYETRYRRKLNMLEPGTRMLKLSAILAAAGLCALFKWTLAARLLAPVAGLIAGILLLLVAVELHQDKVLNEIAAQEALDMPRDSLIAKLHPPRTARRNGGIPMNNRIDKERIHLMSPCATVCAAGSH